MMSENAPAIVIDRPRHAAVREIVLPDGSSATTAAGYIFRVITPILSA
jgi:hypothetical protein